jgi:putative FmdB family regulatory protein
MPIYEYRCENRHHFDVRQSFADDPVTKCEVCGAPVQRVFHPVAVHFKGSGFYNTDYGTRKRSREMKEAAKSESNGNGNGNGNRTSDGGGKEKSKDSSSDSKSNSSSSKSESGASSAPQKSESKAS